MNERILLALGLFVFIVITLTIHHKREKKRYKELNKASAPQKDLESHYNKFIHMLKIYGKYLEEDSIKNSSLSIQHISKLPVDKDELLKYSYMFIGIMEKDIQKLILSSVPFVAYYRNDVPIEGCELFASNDNLTQVLEKMQGMKEEEASIFLKENKIDLENTNLIKTFIEYYQDCLKKDLMISEALKERINKYKV